MAISIKTSEDIEKMRVAGRLAAEVLEMIEPYIKRASPPANWTVSVTITSLTNNTRSPPASATTAIRNPSVSLLMKWCATAFRMTLSI
ncbi:methionine aminopeptidase [Salmonella enterica subsp. enterica]|uniref:Methionine aminopeptidase n=1 Tax=Salmonella enterica I TaxID=59201 RepID=A0A379V0Q8_SALET|nr:methionine aminopeptidase [Salmonella enterica subsp. enterica]